MNPPGSIFLDFNLPNAPTWFYFSLLLAVALFFKFGRFLSMRNLDILGLYLMVPGMLLVLEGSGERLGYALLAGATGFWVLRCLIDLTLVRRPALAPNLTSGGLTWLALALFVSLCAVAAREPGEQPAPDSKTPPVVQGVQRQGEALVRQQTHGQATEASTRLWVARTLAVLCHLAIVIGLVLAAGMHFQDLHAGLAAATFYLLLPYTYLLLPGTNLQIGQWHHAWPMAMLVWAVVAYRRPTLAGLLLGVAAGSVYFPALIVPVWASFYWRRGAGRFLVSAVLGGGLCLAFLAVVAWIRGDWPDNFSGVMPAPISDWLPWMKPAADSHGLWHGLHWAYRMPVFVAYLMLVIGGAFWPAPKNLAHVLALSSAVLVGTQFWYADRGGAHVLWYLPYLLLLVFRPNLTDRQAPPIVSETDWLAQVKTRLSRFFAWLLGIPEPLVKSGG